jgi:hypothetical protein
MGAAARRRRQRRATAEATAGAAARAWMRPRRRLAIVGAIAIAAAVGLGGVVAARVAGKREPSVAPPLHTMTASAEPHVTIEREPDDLPEEAQAITLPARVQGQLGAGDRDLFAFAIDEPGGFLVDAWLTTPGRARLRVLRREGTELATVTAPERIGSLGLVRGQYLVAVEEAGGGGTYELMLRARAWVHGLDWEPDDNPAQAQEMEPLERSGRDLWRYRAAGSWSRRGDVDCFRVPLAVPAAGAQLRVELTPPAGVSARVAVYDAGEPRRHLAPQELVAITRPAGARAILPAIGARAWEPSYSVCVAAAAGEAFGERYRLEVRAFANDGPFEFEPNDGRDTASALPRDVPLHGYLGDGDVDWLRISAAARAQARVRLSLPDGVAAELILRDEAGRELARAHGEPRRDVTLAAAATFVELRAQEGGNVEQPYTIVVTP